VVDTVRVERREDKKENKEVIVEEGIFKNKIKSLL
jgi:hypothetical protein